MCVKSTRDKILTSGKDGTINVYTHEFKLIE